MREGRAVRELVGELDGPLVRGERRLCLALVRQGDRERDEPPEVEGRIVDGAFLARLDAFPKETNGVLVCVGLRVALRQHGLHAYLLLRVGEQLRHALRPLDQREGLLRLGDHVVGDREVAQAHQLVLGAEPVLETLEDRDRRPGMSLLDRSTRFKQIELRRRRSRGASQKVRWAHAEDPGNVFERLHRRARPPGLEHGDVGLGVLRFRYLSLGKAFRGSQRTDSRPNVGHHR